MSLTLAQDRLFELDHSLRTVPAAIKVPQSDTIKQRIFGAYELAKPYEIEHGSLWYPEAHNLCRSLQEQYADTTSHLSLEHIVGIVACLSPMQSWSRNIKLSHLVFQRGGNTDGLGLGYVSRDAAAIYAGASPEEILFASNRNNLKVRSFYQNIRDPEDPYPVTVDRHIGGLVSFDPLAYARRRYLPKSEYIRIADGYREVAKELELVTSRLQAITWLVSRRLQGLGDQPVVATPSLF